MNKSDHDKIAGKLHGPVADSIDPHGMEITVKKRMICIDEQLNFRLNG